MDKKLILLILILVVALAGFYFLNPNSKYMTSFSNKSSQALNLNGSSTVPSSAPSSQPSSTPQASPAAEPVSHPDGLISQDLVLGTGAAVKSGDTVTVNYLGTLEDGTKFDSSYDRNQPFTTQIGVGQVIQGWDEGIVGMQVGGKRKLTIPAALGYGDQPAGTIPPNSTLVFEVELLSVK